MLIITILFLIIILIYSVCTYDKNKEKKENQKYDAILSIVSMHIIGLPLSEQTVCRVFLCKDKIIIKNLKNVNIYNLSMNKILDVNIKSEKEIQISYTSSVGGAVGGAVLFGPLGAMIGGRKKKKVDKIIHSFLIFTYNNEKENKTDYISFDVTNNLKAYKFVDYFYKNCKRNTVTEL